MRITLLKSVVVGGALLLLVSCLGGEGAGVRFSSRLAVVQEQPRLSLFVRDDSIPDGYLITSPAFEARTDLREGDCCLVEYRLDYGAEKEQGIYPVEIYSCDTIPKSPLVPVLTDTAHLLENEQIVSLSFRKSLYLKRRYFLQVQVREHQATRRDLFDLSYDPEQTVLPAADGRHVYRLYFRSRKDLPADTVQAGSLVVQNAFVMDDFVERIGAREQAAGSDSLHFFITYPRSFNTDTTGLIWESTDTFSIRL